MTPQNLVVQTVLTWL